MDFILADLAPPPSGSPVDRGVKTARLASSPSSSDNRRNFSGVLQGVRGEERRGETREADDARSTNKPDRAPRSKEANSLKPSATQTERAETSPSLAQAPTGSRSSDEENRVGEDSRKALESTNQPSNASSDSQGQVPTPLLSLVSLPVLAEANDHTNVHAEEGESEREIKSDGGSSSSPLIVPRSTNAPTTVSDRAEDHSLPDNERSSQPDLLANEPDAPVIHTRSDSHDAQVVKPGPHMIAEDAGTEIANRVETRSVYLESQPGSALPQPEAIVSRASHAHLGAGLAVGKAEIPKPDSVIRDGVSVDRSAPAQVNGYAQSLGDDQDIGVRTRWVFQDGQQSSFEGAERFSEFWDDQHSPQHDQTETKLPQAAVVDHQVANGQPTELFMVGIHGRGVSSPPPPTSHFLSQAQPAMPAHDPAEQSVRLMTRSVVLDLAQPDLGHVNIRVAMTNDVVHTHLLADRPEVGQFFINGQDRLQAAFQANGLDMGQFRVDIDRQSAGRSFHHGPSQEQGQTWNHGSQGMNWGQNPDRQDEQRPSLHSLLNVVA